jgi:hypothetical protein
MITQFEIQLQEFSTEQEKLEQLNSPLQIVVDRSLNNLSYTHLIYPSQFEDLLFSSKDDFIYPGAMRLMARHKDKKEDAGETKSFFQGVLSSYNIWAGGQIGLTYVDPMIVANEVDRSENWQNATLESVISNCLKNASIERGGKALKANFKQGGNLPIASITNMGKTDLEFIQELADRYGLRFYFNHAEAKAEEVVFFIPDLSKSADTDISYESIQATASLQSSVLAVPSSVVVQRGDGAEEVQLKSFEKSFSPSFEKKVQLRERQGIDLNRHLFCPGISSREGKAIAEAEFYRRALQGDRLEFSSQEFYELGSLLKVQRSQTSVVRGQRFEGVYLIEKVRSVQEGLGWVHHYRGVRP